MKFLKIALATTAMFGMAATAQAQDTGAYINLGIDAVEFDSYNVSAKLGYDFTENFAVEGQAAFGIIDDKETINGVEAKAGVDSSFAGFFKAALPVSEQGEIFARVGYHTSQIGGSVEGVASDVSVDFDGIAFGAGGQYWLNEQSGVRLEYTKFDGGDDADGGADVYSLSYVRKF